MIILTVTHALGKNKENKTMMFKDKFDECGDEAWKVRERNRKRREFILQAFLILILVALLVAASVNVSDNLNARHIRSGFDFLLGPAGFEVGETPIDIASTDPMYKILLVGLLNTLKVSVFGIIGATVLGGIVGVMRLSSHPMLRFLGAAHVEAYRNVPLLVLLLAIYLVVTELLPAGRQALHLGDWLYLSKSGLQFAEPVGGGILLGALLLISTLAGIVVRWLLKKRTTGLNATLAGMLTFGGVFVLSWLLSGVIGGWNHPVQTRFALRGGGLITPEFLTLWLGLVLFTSASIAEIVRAGVQSVRSEQWEAGYALGLRKSDVFNYIVMPQSMRLIVPPLSSQYMNLTKNSSLAVMVGYPDIVSIGNTVINVSAQALEVICLTMIVYLGLNLTISLIMNRVNTLVMRAQ